MTITITPKFISTIDDDPAAEAAGEVTPSRWNEGSNITMATGRMLGRIAADTGAVEELTPNDVSDLINMDGKVDVDAPLATDGVDYVFGVRSGANIRTVPPFITPDDHGATGGSDDTLALLNARDAARLVGRPVLITSDITISQAYEVVTGDHVVIAPGVRVIAKATGFTGDSLFVVGDKGDANAAQDWSITGLSGGAGIIECQNVIGKAIDIQWGRFARVMDLDIKGAAENAICVDAGAAYRSYDVNMRNCRLWYNDVLAATDSIALRVIRGSDLYTDMMNIVGYRKGVRVETDSVRVELLRHHVWNRPIHGPLTHCFDIQGGKTHMMSCYADHPNNFNGNLGTPGFDGTITEVYGFFLHGYQTVMEDCGIFLSTFNSPDTSQDDLIRAIHMDREVYGTIEGPFSIEGSTALKRYKSILTGGNGSTTFRAPIMESFHVVDTASAKSIMSGTDSLQALHNGPEAFENTSTFNGNVILNGGVDFSGADPSVNLAVLQALTVRGAAGTSRDINLNSDAIRRWILRCATDENFHLIRNDAAGAFVDVPFQILDDTGVIRLNTLQASTSYADDTAAQAGGVPVGGLYRNGSVVQVRVV